MCRIKNAKYVGLKLPNVSDWNCQMCRIENAKYVGLKLPNISDWNIIVYKVKFMNYKNHMPRPVDKIVDKY